MVDFRVNVGKYTSPMDPIRINDRPPVTKNPLKGEITVRISLVVEIFVHLPQ